MAKEGITVAANILQHYMDIGELVDGDVSAEVIVYNWFACVAESNPLNKVKISK